MNIAIAQLNYHIGNFEGNLEKMSAAVARATSLGADLVVFSELSVCGYPPLDLLERKDFISRCTRYIQLLAESIDPDTGVLELLDNPAPYPNITLEQYV